MAMNTEDFPFGVSPRSSMLTPCLDVHQSYIVSGLEAPDKPYVTEDIPYVHIYIV